MEIPFITAFVGGILSFLSPCVLPLVPAYISYMSGVSIEDLAAGESRQSMHRAGMRSIAFVMGFSLVFTVMGATATSISQALMLHRELIMKVAGTIIVVFGLHMLGVFRIRALYSERRFHLRIKSVGYLGAFLLGITFAFGWTPCVGPVLGTILTIAANSGRVTKGAALLAVYSLGLGIPFVLTGFATSHAVGAMNRIKPHFRKIEIASGALLILVGVLIFTAQLQILSGPLQELMPWEVG